MKKKLETDIFLLPGYRPAGGGDDDVEGEQSDALQV